MSKSVRMCGALVALMCGVIALPAQAQDKPEDESAATPEATASEAAALEAPPKSGMRYDAYLSLRNLPLAAALTADVGYRKSIENPDSTLFKGTYLEGGGYFTLSPAGLRAGGYFDLLPIALLNIRGELQYQQYFGILGFTFVPTNADRPDEIPEWGLEDFNNAQDNDLGVPAVGLLAQIAATPRIRVKNFLATAETRLVHSRLNIDTRYQEALYDILLEPRADTFFAFRPWVGYMIYQKPETGYLLAAVRYDRLNAFGTDIQRQGLGGLLIWGLPRKWLGKGRYSVVLLGNRILEDPTDRQGRNIFAIRLRGTFGAN